MIEWHEKASLELSLFSISICSIFTSLAVILKAVEFHTFIFYTFPHLRFKIKVYKKLNKKIGT
jgi:hypothetical protein